MILTINVIFFGQKVIFYTRYIFPEGFVSIKEQWVKILQSCETVRRSFQPGSQPVVLLQRLEEHPEWREIMVSACVQTKDLYHLIVRICMARRTKCFLWSLCYPFIFCGLKLLGWFLICVGLNVLHTFCNIGIIISCMTVMICHVGEIRHMYWFTVPTSEGCLKVNIT